MHLDDLNGLTAADAARELLRCCGSTRWAGQMASARPFASVDAIIDAADRIWWGLGEADWREAFAAHPAIGAGTAGRAGGAGRATSTEAWSADEQSGVVGAAADVTERLARGNRDYEARFGYIFIICAAGQSAAAMLDALERRLGNPPEQELRIAAAEQRSITRLRLRRLLGEYSS
jgi:2-oxo-4-hydroxy-4-carboxy-5-ureidoimidazoline decarboxylase